MPTDLTTLPNRVSKLTGCRLLPLEYGELRNPQHIQGSEQNFGLLFYWPKTAPPYFGLKAAQLTDWGDEVTPTITSIDAILEKFGNREMPERFRLSHHLLAIPAQRNRSIQFLVRIDTQHEIFVRDFDQAMATPNKSLTWEIKAWAFGLKGDQRDEIKLQIALAPLPTFLGFVALDFGNTSSILCALDQTAQYAADARFLPDVPYVCRKWDEGLSPPHGSTSVPSVVRLEKMVNCDLLLPNATDKEKRRMLDEALDAGSGGPGGDVQFPPRALEWTIGHSAGESSTNSDGLIIGPKRLMTRPEELEQYTLVARDFLDPHGLDKPIRRAVENTLPAELYICRLLQTFMALKRALPAQLAVTYPTTFSEREAQRLKEVIYRAHLRLQRKRQKSNSPSEEELRRVIALALDEASAAGLSFLQRHFLESPGALERFRYLYPRGFNLLLYDCGGGTTDIALIHAVSRETKRLEVEVLGRSGVREFGGDLITQEIFRLIKAQFARWLLENGALESAELRERLQHRETADAILGPFPAMKKNMPEGDYAAALRKYLDDNAKTIEAIVPTQFTPEGQTSSDRLNQIHVLELWRLAERLKMELVSSTNPKVTEVLTEGRLAATLRNRYFPRSAPSEDWLRLSVNRHEVDALIREWVDESVKCCNALILQKLIGWQEGEGIVQASDFGARQVDCVCVVGNGARYPLVMKMLRENLKIPFLDDEPPQEGVGPSPPQDPASPGGMRKFIFDDRFAKLGVAHGALMDMLYAQGCRGITVEFSKDFSKRIPFTLVWFDSNANTPRKLFFEGERYEELGVATIPAPPEVSEEGPPQERRSISLQQSWPGSNKPRSYVTFNFERPTEGAIDVSYNVERQQFRAVDEANQEGKPTYSVDHELYRSPVQRGTL